MLCPCARHFILTQSLHNTGSTLPSADSRRVQAGTFFAILGRGPTAFQIGKISVVNP